MDKSNKHRNKRDELIEIAENLFLEKGYEKTSIKDILRVSGLSKGGFYHYFGSKEEVLSGSINNLIDNFLGELYPIVEDQELDALEKLNRFMEKKSALQEPKREYANYFAMVMRTDFTVYKFYLSLARKFVEPLAKIIEQGTSEGIFTVKYPQETADILLRAVTSLPQSPFFDEYKEDTEKAFQYRESMKEIMARSLGIDKDILKMV